MGIGLSKEYTNGEKISANTTHTFFEAEKHTWVCALEYELACGEQISACEREHQHGGLLRQTAVP